MLLIIYFMSHAFREHCGCKDTQKKRYGYTFFASSGYSKEQQYYFQSFVGEKTVFVEGMKQLEGQVLAL